MTLFLKDLRLSKPRETILIGSLGKKRIKGSSNLSGE